MDQQPKKNTSLERQKLSNIIRNNLPVAGKFPTINTNNIEEIEIIPDSIEQEDQFTTNKETESNQKTPLEKKLQEAIKKDGSSFYNLEDLTKIDNILKEFANSDPKFKVALNGVYLADKLNSKTLGKIVYQNFKKIKTKKGKEFVNQIPNEYAFDATREAGFHTFASWDTLKGNFYIESTKNIDKIIQEIIKINPESEMSTIIEKENPNHIIGKINNMTEEEFRRILLTENKEEDRPKENPEIVEIKKELIHQEIIEIEERIKRREEKIKELEEKILEFKKTEN